MNIDGIGKDDPGTTTMEYNKSLDYTTEFTHNERDIRNTSTKYLNDKTTETVRNRFKIENERSALPLRNGLPFIQSPSAEQEAAFVAAYNDQYAIDRYSGIANRSNNLTGSATKIHSTVLKPEDLEVERINKNVEDEQIVAKRAVMPNITRVPPTSSSIIRNNPAVVAGIFKDSSDVNSNSIIRGDRNSIPFGKISNIDGKSNIKYSTDKTTSLVTASVPDRVISTKQSRPFGMVSNTNYNSFSRIHKNTNNIQRTTDLGFSF